MTARILVVDDIAANVKLLEARLMAEYFQVLTASNGADALEICKKGLCDLVLLDVMMPQMDGFEVCRQLKEDPKTSFIPVVMVTALDLPEDRVKGLECGADDFLTKPVNDLTLITRVKSLVRLKSLTDELRLRAQTGKELELENLFKSSEKNSKILVVDERPSSYEKVVKVLAGQYSVSVVPDAQEALFKAAEEDFDTVIVSLSLSSYDPLRFCSHLRSLERTRLLPILAIADHEHEDRVIRALDLGVNDYIRRPIDPNELLARVRSQVKRKNYNTLLGESVQESIELSVRDGLTGLHNRRYLDSHLGEMLKSAKSLGKPMSLIICDIDRFKLVNDEHGHDVGDEVIREFSERIRKNIRTIDLACRYGGEEFVVAMPDTDMALALVVAERLRNEVAAHPFIVANGAKQLPITVSVGVSTFQDGDDTPKKLMKRADLALYQAKSNGRNQVVKEIAA
ncbi:MAG: PleD family two-component system response regulator [Rhizobiaceae bacterium]|nr:PleD family two-component system response regulator [Rhizobiaceae bacterium]